MEMYKKNISMALNCELNQMKSTINDHYWIDQIISENLAPERFMNNFSEMLNFSNVNKVLDDDEELVDKSVQMNTNDFISPVKDTEYDKENNNVGKKNYENFNYTLSGTKS